MDNPKKAVVTGVILLSVAAVIGKWTAPVVQADDETAYKIGEPVEVLYAGSWYPGKVVEIGADKDKGRYKIKYEGSSPDSWQGPDRLRRKGEQRATKFTLEKKDTFGTWTIATVTRTTETTGAKETTTTRGTAIPGNLTIKSDGTYTWVLSKDEVIEGKWKEEPKPAQYRGPVILVKGMLGNDWWVHYDGKSDTGEDGLYIRSDAGTRYWGTKVKEPKAEPKK